MLKNKPFRARTGFNSYHKIVVCDHVCLPKFGIHYVCGLIPKSIYQASYLLPSDFPNNFAQARSYLNRMKDC